MKDVQDISNRIKEIKDFARENDNEISLLAWKFVEEFLCCKS